MHNKSGAKIQKFSHICKRARQIIIKTERFRKISLLSLPTAYPYSRLRRLVGEAFRTIISLVRH